MMMFGRRHSLLFRGTSGRRDHPCSGTVRTANDRGRRNDNVGKAARQQWQAGVLGQRRRLDLYRRWSETQQSPRGKQNGRFGRVLFETHGSSIGSAGSNNRLEWYWYNDYR